MFIIYHLSKRKNCERNTVKHGVKGRNNDESKHLSLLKSESLDK